MIDLAAPTRRAGADPAAFFLRILEAVAPLGPPLGVLGVEALALDAHALLGTTPTYRGEGRTFT